MPPKGNPITKKYSRTKDWVEISCFSGTWAKYWGQKGSGIPLSKESFKQVGATQHFQLSLTGQQFGFPFTQTLSAIPKLYEQKTSDKEEKWHDWNAKRENWKICHIGKVISCKCLWSYPPAGEEGPHQKFGLSCPLSSAMSEGCSGA